MIKFWKLYKVYSSLGQIKAIWSVIRIAILPFWKIDRIVGRRNNIVDIGCGNGALANYLAINDYSRQILGIDYSKKRILDAKKTSPLNRNVKFVYGDVVSKKLPPADCYLICDVLHHIPYEQQEKLLSSITKKMKKENVLIIKEVDPSNRVPFLFGHLWEKILYPHEQILTRTKKQWVKLLHKLDLAFKMETGAFYFPDSTVIFICRKKYKH